jgi:amino-acid N-acetyltransferase
MRPLANPTVERASEADTQAIRDLLGRNELPTSDLSTARPEFVVVRSAGQIIGAGALEHFGGTALLRSVAVEPQWRGSGVGQLLIAELESRARAVGVSELILLTLTAADFFRRLGYGAKDRARVPSALLESAEFKSLCPASAICMAKVLA